MQTVVVTGWHAKGFKEFAHRFVDSFDRFWSGNIPLACYVEVFVPIPRGEMHHRDQCPGLKDFLEENAGNDLLNGREPNDSWKPRDRESGYNWRFDAVRFCKQLCYPAAIASTFPATSDIALAWFDADVVTYKPVPEDMIERFLGDHDLVYLGRPGKHSEIGFWAVRLNPRSRAFLRDLASAYPSGRFREFKEWHSAYVFDRIREEHEAKGLKAHNLTPNGRGHVWFQHELGLYTDHCKGNRKAAGISPERPR